MATKKKKPNKTTKKKKPLSVVELLKSYNGVVPDMWHELGSPVSGVDKWSSVAEPSKSQLQSLVQESTSFACARWIANIIASTPLRLLITRETDDNNFQTPVNKRKRLEPRHHKYLLDNHKAVKAAGVVEEVIDHPWLDLIEEPNPWLDGHSLKELWSYYLDATGESYTEVKEAGGTLQLWIYPPHTIEPILNSDNQTVKHYELNSGTADVRTIQPDDMLVMAQRDLHHPLAYGRGNLRNAYELINLEKLMLSYQSTTMENGGTPSAIMSPKEPFGAAESQRMAKSFQQLFKQIGNGGVLFLQEPFDFNQFSVNPKDVLSIEQLTHIANKIATSFGIPLALIDSSSVSADATYYSAIRQALQVAVLPRLRKIETCLNRFVRRYDDRLYFAFDDPMPRNEQYELQRWTADIQGITARVLQINEFRRRHDLPPVPGGDTFAELQGQGIMPASAIQDIRSAKSLMSKVYKSVPHNAAPLTAVLKEFFAEQGKATIKQLLYSSHSINPSKGIKAPAYDPTIDLSKWSDELYERTMPVLKLWHEKTSNGFLESMGVERNEWGVVQDNLHQQFEKQVIELCNETQRTTSLQIDDAIASLKNDLLQGIVEGDYRELLVARVQKVFDQASTERAWRIATTEESRVRHKAELGSAKEIGLKGKAWLRDTLNNCEECAEIAKKSPGFVPLDHKFFESTYSDGQQPPAHPHCGCSLSWEVN